MSKRVNVDEVREGMELEIAVKNHYGQLLLPVNTVITEKHKNVFKTWGIDSIHIKSEPSDTDNPVRENDETAEEMISLQERFGWSPRNLNEEDLFKMVSHKISVYDKK